MTKHHLGRNTGVGNSSFENLISMHILKIFPMVDTISCTCQAVLFLDNVMEEWKQCTLSVYFKLKPNFIHVDTFFPNHKLEWRNKKSFHQTDSNSNPKSHIGILISLGKLNSYLILLRNIVVGSLDCNENLRIRIFKLLHQFTYQQDAAKS